MNNHPGWTKDGKCIWCSTTDSTKDCSMEKDCEDSAAEIMSEQQHKCIEAIKNAGIYIDTVEVYPAVLTLIEELHNRFTEEEIRAADNFYGPHILGRIKQKRDENKK